MCGLDRKGGNKRHEREDVPLALQRWGATATKETLGKTIWNRWWVSGVGWIEGRYSPYVQ